MMAFADPLFMPKLGHWVILHPGRPGLLLQDILAPQLRTSIGSSQGSKTKQRCSEKNHWTSPWHQLCHHLACHRQAPQVVPGGEVALSAVAVH